MRYVWPLLAGVLLLLGACSGDDSDDTPSPTMVATPAATEAPASVTPGRTQTSTPTITPSASPSPVAELCPIAADACSFAAQTAMRVLAGDGDGVLSSARSTFYDCPGPNGGPGDPFPLCDGARIGERRAGFPLRQIEGEAGAVSEAEAVRLVPEWSSRTEPSLRDAYGDGGARAFTIACPDVGQDEGTQCRDRFSLVFSGLAPGANAADPPLRTMLIMDVGRADNGELRADGFATGVLTSGLDYALRGGGGSRSDPSVPSVLAPPPLDWSSVTFFAWDPTVLIR